MEHTKTQTTMTSDGERQRSLPVMGRKGMQACDKLLLFQAAWLNRYRKQAILRETGLTWCVDYNTLKVNIIKSL